MDFWGLVLFSVIGGLLGWAVTRYIGFNPWTVIGVVMAVSLLLPFFIYLFAAANDPENGLDYVHAMVKYLADHILEILAGDVAAVIVAAITGRRQG